MKIFILSLVLVNSFAYAEDGLTIGNSFQVDKEGFVFRGREPKKLISELPEIGITDVLIFKNELKEEVQKEKAELKALGITPHHIPFAWKKFSPIVACGQVVEALNLIYKVKSQSRKIFFHCTAGEDRTGMLAGLYRMLEENLSTSKTFKVEMCARGYSDGNLNKPRLVSASIQKELTPLFLALTKKIEEGEWELGHISKTTCKNLITEPTDLKCHP